MASRYQTGTAVSATAVLDQLASFLVAQGWMTNLNAAEGTGKRVHASKGGVTVNLRSAVAESNVFTSQSGAFTGIGINISTSYAAASAWYAQPGAPAGVTAAAYETAALQLKAGLTSYVYHLFDDGADNVTVVVEADTGIFSYLGFGVSITKIGAWTGGAYFYGRVRGHALLGAGSITADRPLRTAGSAFMRLSADGASWGLLDLVPTASTGLRMLASTTGQGAFYEYPSAGALVSRGVSALTSEASLVPAQLLVARSAGGWSYLGGIPSLYCTTAVGQGFSAGSTYTRGTDSYVLFPNFAVKK